jgi:geranylgeranyl pyrophosphate synthase
MTQNVAEDFSDKALIELLNSMREQVDGCLRDVAFIPEAIRPEANYALYATGNRMRPLLYLTALGALGCDWQSRRNLEAACMLELFHKSSLVFDDIHDQDTMRKGKPTLHADVGFERASLAGICLLIGAYDQLLGEAATLPPEQVMALRSTILKTVEGQTIDLRWLHTARDRSTYFHVVRGKTAMLTRMCVEFAAFHAGVASSTVAALGRYGENVGIAYQLFNDVKGFSGAERLSGRGDWGDVRRGRPTIVEVLAGERALSRLEFIAMLEGSDDSLLRELVDCAEEEGRMQLGQARAALTEIWDVLCPPYRSLLAHVTDRVATAWKDTDWDLLPKEAAKQASQGSGV